MEIKCWEAIRITLATIPWCVSAPVTAEPSSRFMPIAAVAFPPGRAAVQVRTLAPANVYSGNAGVLINPERRFSRSRPRIVMTWLWCGSRSRIGGYDRIAEHAASLTGELADLPRIERGLGGPRVRASRGPRTGSVETVEIAHRREVGDLTRQLDAPLGLAGDLALDQKGSVSPAFAGPRLADRCRPELDSARVLSSSWFTLREWVARTYPGAPEERYARLSKSFARWIVRQDWRGANAIIGFVRNIDPERCAAARKRGLVRVVDQMVAPAATQRAEAQRQFARWPHWSGRADLGNLDLMLEIERIAEM